MRSDSYRFADEDARWLPLDEAVLAVRKCLHSFIAGLARSRAWLIGEADERPDRLMSQLFALVCNNECRAFEELCDRVNECAPGSIGTERVRGILDLGTILAESAEDLLPDDDDSCNDLRNAMTSLFTLACNTPSKMSRETFKCKVEKTRSDICDGFKSLSNGFRKLERRRERGQISDAPTKVELSDASLAKIDAIHQHSVDAVSERFDQTEDAMHHEAAELRHEIGRIRKGGKAKKKWGIEEQKACHKLWESNKHNPYIKEQMEHDGRIQRSDVFTHCRRELAKYHVESAEEFTQILEQYRKRCKKP